MSVSPRTGEADLVVVNRERRRIETIGPALTADLAWLRRRCAGEPVLLGRSATDQVWLIMDFVDDGPATYLVYDRNAQDARVLFTHQPALAEYLLASVEPFSFRARDGLDIHGYLTFPAGLARQGLPTVLAVHGGP